MRKAVLGVDYACSRDHDRSLRKVGLCSISGLPSYSAQSVASYDAHFTTNDDEAADLESLMEIELDIYIEPEKAIPHDPYVSLETLVR